MGKLFRRKRLSLGECQGSDKKEDKLSEIVVSFLRIYFERLKSEGLKNKISKVTPKGLDYFILSQVKKHLSPKKVIHLGKGLGMIDIQYKKGGLQLDPCGPARILIKRIVINNEQILYAIDSIIEQFEKKYIYNSDYIIERVNKILKQLSDTGIYKPETHEEKTIYDLALLIVLNYYKNDDKRPEWIKIAINNLKKGEFIEDWIEAILEHIYTFISNMSENLYFDFKITFDSMLLRAMFNKKTNNGQISKLLMLMGIDIKDLIYSIAYDYLSPSFITGAGELLRDLAETFMCDFGKKKIKIDYDKGFPLSKTVKKEKVNIYNITMTFGEKITSQRAFRWYFDKKLDLFLQISKDSAFSNSRKIKSTRKYISYPEPMINLGIITSYTIKKSFQYSVETSDLQNNSVYYYRVCDYYNNIYSETYKICLENFQNECEFLVLADSQGMVKQDYDIFLKTFEHGIKNFDNTNFVIHMGDFVDDGNNELYWRWILDSKLWAENVTVPLSGNHEAKLSPVAFRANVENSILRHFNLKNLPEQSLTSGAYYSYTYENVLFIVLNTNNMNEYSMLDQEQYAWVLDTAKKSNMKWKILLTHKSPYSNGPHHDEKDSREIGRQIVELCYEANIDLVIGGHDHVYVRTPVMSWGKCIEHPSGKIKKYGITYDLFSNPLGTIFIIPGTSGVKNYKADMSTAFPTEKIIDLNCPVYSRVKVAEDKIFFTSYKYNPLSDTADCIDSIAIEKNIKEDKKLNNETVMKKINCIANIPWAPSKSKIDNALSLFKKLDYYGRLLVYNYRKLIYVNKLNQSYSRILRGEIEIVRNKREFLIAIKNKNIKTVVTDCAEIKFENFLGMENKITVNRDLCIRGTARLCLINFIITEGAMLILGDSVCIDNSRRIFSGYTSLNAVEIKDNSNFAMLDYSSIRCFGGVGFRSHGIYMSGRGTSAFFNTKSENFSAGEFIYSPHDETNIFLCNGKYFSYKNNFACISAGKVQIDGGHMQGIKLLPGAKGEMYDGKITGNSKAIQSMGKLKIYGGIIESSSGPGIDISGWDGCIYVFPDHKGSVKINKEDVFIGEIKQSDNDNVKINIFKKNVGEGYKDIGVYYFPKDHIKEHSLEIKLIKRNVKNGDILKLEDLPKNIIIMGKTYNGVLKGKVAVRGGAKYCVFSKLFIFNREYKEKKDEK